MNKKAIQLMIQTLMTGHSAKIKNNQPPLPSNAIKEVSWFRKFFSKLAFIPKE